jgi:hypothetical protein
MTRQELRNTYPFHFARVEPMKVKAINPGRVYPPIQSKNTWTYSIEYVYPTGAHIVSAGINYPSANAAKQAMREEVSRLRRKHGVN